MLFSFPPNTACATLFSAEEPAIVRAMFWDLINEVNNERIKMCRFSDDIQSNCVLFIILHDIREIHHFHKIASVVPPFISYPPIHFSLHSSSFLVLSHLMSSHLSSPLCNSFLLSSLLPFPPSPFLSSPPYCSPYLIMS